MNGDRSRRSGGKLLLLAWTLFVPALAACGGGAAVPMAMAGTDPEHGRLLLRQLGCGTCHAIPGVAAAGGNVGPTLAAWSRNVYIAGVAPNTPENLVRFIRAPQSFDPLSAMPDLQVSEPHARDMVAYLAGLR